MRDLDRLAGGGSGVVGEDGDQAGGEAECRGVLGEAEGVSRVSPGECVEDVEEEVIRR